MRGDINPHLKSVVLGIVEKQISTNNPPETRQTYERLLREGRSENEAKALIGSIVDLEIFEVANSREPYDHDRFIQALNKLPELPEG